MKNFYPRFCKVLVTFILIFGSTAAARSQILGVGDIAFTGYTSGGAVDSFSFVLLVDIPLGTVINFTDDAWLGASFSGGEETVTWTADAFMTAGREITIFGLTAIVTGPPVTPGTVTGTAISLTTSGDQVLAYQGTAASPSFISGIHMNVYSPVPALDCDNTTAATWDPACVGSGGSFCIKPAVITTGGNAIWIGTEGDGTSERDNARFNGCALNLSTAALVRAAVNDQANWVTDQLTPNESYNPSGCNFLVPLLPVSLVSFIGRLNPDKTVILQWKVSEQQDIREYIVEESTDGITFIKLGSVTAGNSTSETYSFIDRSLTAKNFYRLKIVEQTGKVLLSNTIYISLTASALVDIYPNPVTDKLTIRQSGGLVIKTAWLFDVQRKLLQQVQITNEYQLVNMGNLHPGIYHLKMDDGTVFKVVKK